MILQFSTNFDTLSSFRFVRNPTQLCSLPLFALLHVLDRIEELLPALGGLSESLQEFVGRVPGAAAHGRTPTIRYSGTVCGVPRRRRSGPQSQRRVPWMPVTR